MWTFIKQQIYPFVVEVYLTTEILLNMAAQEKAADRWSKWFNAHGVSGS